MPTREGNPNSTACLCFVDLAERGCSPVNVIPLAGYRWAIFEMATRTIWIGGPGDTSHLTVAERAGVLKKPVAYYRPGPDAQICGGYVVRSVEGQFMFDPFSGTFPGTVGMCPEADHVLAICCARDGMKWAQFEISKSPGRNVRP